MHLGRKGARRAKGVCGQTTRQRLQLHRVGVLGLGWGWWEASQRGPAKPKGTTVQKFERRATKMGARLGCKPQPQKGCEVRCQKLSRVRAMARWAARCHQGWRVVPGRT